MRFFISFIMLMVLLAIPLGGAAWFLGYLQPPGPTVTFTVQKGENFASLARQLESAGIIEKERALRWYVNFFAPMKKLKRGEFALYQKMPVPEVVKVLTEGKPVEYKFTVPEGQNVFQIAEDLEAKGFSKREDFLAAARSPELLQLIPGNAAEGSRPKSIEGYMFPDTYLLQRVFTAKEIAQMMVQHFREVYHSVEGELKNNGVVQEFRFTPHQVITLASIVEKETGAGKERPLVASIFLNRLRKRMRLQTDPTVIYGVYLAKGSWDGDIHRRDLNARTDYNTYQMDGLPPGPIANPGLSAIRAVLNPAQTEYLYFVSRGDGTHIFSKDYSAHAKAVRETQLTPSAKEGKSWRNLPADQRAK